MAVLPAPMAKASPKIPAEVAVAPGPNATANPSKPVDEQLADPVCMFSAPKATQPSAAFAGAGAEIASVAAAAAPIISAPIRRAPSATAVC
ncbi:hypothetical protein MANY_35510 [Mycolicibacterium anyangense]|uniref:Uncharacterized protein n=1 Tax=Mycolicibacterium anyangense TaxID=1431246 RepID=A0A6N4WDM3_9MYCO|nr:hypothetical protein MANY_35510 [Mycolicibacterium anyangense]